MVVQKIMCAVNVPNSSFQLTNWSAITLKSILLLDDMSVVSVSRSFITRVSFWNMWKVVFIIEYVNHFLLCEFGGLTYPIYRQRWTCIVVFYILFYFDSKYWCAGGPKNLYSPSLWQLWPNLVCDSGSMDSVLFSYGKWFLRKLLKMGSSLLKFTNCIHKDCRLFDSFHLQK